MSQGNFGNLCDTENFGDPVVVYDSFEDRWIITDFAFLTDGGGNVVAPAFQCIAASITGNPLTGGWNFYSRLISDNLNDYPKFGIWPDGLYMTANMYGFGAGGGFQGVRVWAFNKAQMYAGSPTVQVVSFDVGGGDFTIIPSNARLQTGTPPAGRPNLFISTQLYLNALSVYKFHVDWNSISLSTFTGPDVPVSATSWPTYAAGVPQPGTGTLLDSLSNRAMVQAQYANLAGAESLWVSHTVRRAAAGFAAPRWYQVDVTGGTVNLAIPQAATWDPDAADVLHRWMPSLALDRGGNMAMGYSTSSSSAFPSLAYAGRLAGDPANTFSKTQQTLFAGTAAQTGSARWGDYSAMTLDPDGCTFWYTSEYASPAGWLTKFGSFKYSECTPVGAGGTVSGTVTRAVGGVPLAGATVTLGSRTTTTAANGTYSFTPIPAGTYPGLTASFPGCISGAANDIAVTDAATTTRNLALTAAVGSACLTDTTQADFLTGTPTNIDLSVNPGDVTLKNSVASDQANTGGTNTGTNFDAVNWTGQSFIPAVSGTLMKADVQLFCNPCGATRPNLTLSVRATSAGVPTGADLATAIIPGSPFSGSVVLYTATFVAPTPLTSGTQYALILRPDAAPAGTSYFWIRSSPSTYANGQRVLSADSGATWATDVTRDFNFRTYMFVGYSASGDLVSSLKDANPVAIATPTWTTLSWNATTPANTSVKFQVAASNSQNGPFNFVGPDTTAATFFTTSGASLSQFNGKRYLRYRSLLATSDSTVAPTVSDVTACYVDVAPANLSMTVTDGVTAAAPGGQVVYTITAANGGPGAATAATVADTFPATQTCSWTCAPTGTGTCAANGSGAINDPVNLASGDSAVYTATCTIAASATGTVSNTATIAVPVGNTDPNLANNTATDTDTLVPSADLAITKTDGTVNAVPGGSVVYTITASNNGPSNAPGAVVADSFPAGETCTWTCIPGVGATCTASGSGNINDNVNLPAGKAATYTATCAIAPDATGSVSNTATVTSPVGINDPTPGNNTASDNDTLKPAADLVIAVTDGVPTAVPGGSVSYTITASNLAGPSNAPGTTVADTFPATETCTWTCVAAGSAGCTASGSGNINDTVNLPKGGSVVYTAGCGIAPSATGSVSNTATVAASASVNDANAGNNSATDTDTLTVQANVAVTVDDSRSYARVGDSLNYVLHVTNAGPSNATASVHDALPVVLGNGAWTCSGSANVACNNGSGNTLDDDAGLPAGGSADYLYSATLQSDDATNSVTNSASVALVSGTDPTPGNNTGSDTDTIVVYRDKFEGSAENLSHLTASANGTSGADLSIDSGLLNTVGIVPVAVASGRTASGKLLFDIELARFGSGVAVRAVTRDAAGLSQRTAWQSTDMHEHLLSFAWQSAQGTEAGYLSVYGGGAAVQVTGHREQEQLTHVFVRVDNSVPWLVLLAR